MEKREIVSRNLLEVKPNASISTKKPSSVSMEIDRRFSAIAYTHYIDQREGIKPETGLIGFELVAVYEDGQPEPEKSPEELVIEEITDTLDEATAEKTEVDTEPESEEQPELTETEEAGESEKE